MQYPVFRATLLKECVTRLFLFGLPQASPHLAWQKSTYYIVSLLQRPSQLEGYTRQIANDRGHLLEGIPRSKKCPWGGFTGTWDSKEGRKSKPKVPLGDLKHDSAAEILTVHSSVPQSPKENTEKPPPSPVPEPVDEKNIGISKHIESLKEREKEETNSRITSPVPKTAERNPTPVEQC